MSLFIYSLSPVLSSLFLTLFLNYPSLSLSLSLVLSPLLHCLFPSLTILYAYTFLPVAHFLSRLSFFLSLVSLPFFLSLSHSFVVATFSRPLTKWIVLFYSVCFLANLDWVKCICEENGSRGRKVKLGILGSWGIFFVKQNQCQSSSSILTATILC